MNLNRKFKKEKGFALPLVLMVIVVLMILFVSIITVSGTNSKQIALQEDNLRAYYLARSGIDIAYVALMENNEEKFTKFLNDNTPLTDNLELEDEGKILGSVDIEVKELGDEVRIKAFAKTAKGKGSSKLSLYIDKSNISKTRWVKE